MVQLPHLKVFVASGWYDLATPYFAADYTVNHMTVGPEQQGAISRRPTAHKAMMYHNIAAFEQQEGCELFIEKAGK